MARHEQDREDLLREATALVRRSEFTIADEASVYVVGFRRNGAGSIYVDAAPVFHFNAAGELRRAYWQGSLIKAERGRLVRLKRERTPHEVRLRSSRLTPAESDACLQLVAHHCSMIRNAVREDTVTVLGQVPPDDNIMADIGRWLASLRQPVPIAQRPNV